ncbi:TPA: hypothetical protein ACSFNB_000001, partial [Haemophilus influenzae]
VSKQNNLTRLSLISLLLSTSFYPVQSFAIDQPICKKNGDSIACGSGAKAIVRSVAFGLNADASGPDTVAVGLLSKVETVEAYNNEYGK